ncbi:hypothetical protein [Pseudomonas aeruginosa]|uniref:hypothetical protein n=1 Tax=Pseudomonas aeruginosa TaxID=287 RepID=UPI002E2AADE4|nr:hypothetical protein [Pseudomonas aeruginosa]
MRVVSEARALLTEDYRPGEAIYLAGEAAYVTLDAASPVFADMQIQPPRPASFKMLGDGGSLHVGVPNSIMAEVTAQPRVKFYLLADAYLHYMRKLRGDFLFVGGRPTIRIRTLSSSWSMTVGSPRWWTNAFRP